MSTHLRRTAVGDREQDNQQASPPAASSQHSPASIRALALVLATIVGALALAVFVGSTPSHADALCDAMRARFGPGYPCISVPTNTFTPTAPAAPTTTGSTGASGGGPSVGSNIGPGPGEGNGTPIVPVPGQTPIAPAVPGGGRNSGPTTPPTTVAPNPPTPQNTPAPTSSTATPASGSPAPSTAQPSDPGTAPIGHRATIGPADNGDQNSAATALWLVAGAAALLAGGLSARNGRSGRYTALARANGYPSAGAALRSWLPRGGSERATIGPSQLVLINDPTSPREYVFHENVPPGGHIAVNPDGSATIYDRNGQPVSHVAKPWAYDSLGRPQHTWYTVDDNGNLVQHVDAEPNALYPILADPLSGGEDPVTGRPITATPLANGQESIQGEGAGEQIVGNPNPGHAPYQPDTESMLDNRQVTVDQGDGTTNVTKTDDNGQATTTNISTQQSYAQTAREVDDRQQKALRAAQDRRDAWNGKWDGDLSKEENKNSAEATAEATQDGISAVASASRTASKYTAEGGYSNERDGYELTGKAEVGTGANVDATAEAGKDGLGFKLGGFAGGKAGVSGTEGSENSIQLNAGAGVRAGLGADLGFGILKQEDGGWKVGLSGGLALGPGAEGSLSATVNPGKIAHALNPANWW